MVRHLWCDDLETDQAHKEVYRRILRPRRTFII
jgi:hypothetical protein